MGSRPVSKGDVKDVRGGWVMSMISNPATDEQSLRSALVSRFREAEANAAAAAAATITTPPYPSDADRSTSSLPLPTVHVDLRRNQSDPRSSFAFVTPSWLQSNVTSMDGQAGTPPPCWVDALESSLLSDGIIVDGVKCTVKKRRPPKRERVAQNEERIRRKRAARDRAAAKRSRWQADMFGQFPSRGRSIVPHVFVADLDASLLHLVAGVYLPCMFPDSCRDEVIGALRHVWTEHPKSLRIKELFETLEVYKLLERQLSQLMRSERTAANASSSSSPLPVITKIYDLACGHGLLGVLLAYRFASVKVVCVDLKQRPCFDHYLEGFRLHAKSAEGESVPLSNLHFEERDFATLADDDVDSTTFVAMIHGCNEATKVAIEMAQERGAAGWATMPCCIRDGLYHVNRVSNVDDGTRHFIMAGMLAGIYGAHWIAAIDERITNRNIVLFGGYSLAR